jgi:hypothetical protein
MGCERLNPQIGTGARRVKPTQRDAASSQESRFKFEFSTDFPSEAKQASEKAPDASGGEQALAGAKALIHFAPFSARLNRLRKKARIPSKRRIEL